MKKIIILLGLLFFPLYSTFALDTETEKIQWHLDRVEGILRKVETPTLTEDQKLNRIKMLDLLNAYTEAGKFPNNDKYLGESVPFFRGSNGNLCAVGYLMNSDPEYQGFVESVVTQNNTVQIMDIQNDTTVKSWANKYGFNMLELAMIQPTYDFLNTCEYNIIFCSEAGLISRILDIWQNPTVNEEFDFKLAIYLLVTVLVYGLFAVGILLIIKLIRIQLQGKDKIEIKGYLLKITLFLLPLGIYYLFRYLIIYLTV